MQGEDPEKLEDAAAAAAATAMRAASTTTADAAAAAAAAVAAAAAADGPGAAAAAATAAAAAPHTVPKRGRKGMKRSSSVSWVCARRCVGGAGEGAHWRAELIPF